MVVNLMVSFLTDDFDSSLSFTKLEEKWPNKRPIQLCVKFWIGLSDGKPKLYLEFHYDKVPFDVTFPTIQRKWNSK